MHYSWKPRKSCGFMLCKKIYRNMFNQWDCILSSCNGPHCRHQKVGLEKEMATQVLLPGKFHGWRSPVDYSPWSCKESDMTEWLHFLSFYSFFWRRKWQPTLVFLLGESHGRRGLVGCSLWGCKELDTTKQLTHTHTHKGRAVKGIVDYFVQLMYIYWRDGKINAEKEENPAHDHNKLMKKKNSSRVSWITTFYSFDCICAYHSLKWKSGK